VSIYSVDVFDTNVLSAHIDYMLRKTSDNWPHLKTTNPIESTFVTVCLRTVRTKGADVNAVDVLPQTPLDWAIKEKHTETV